MRQGSAVPAPFLTGAFVRSSFTPRIEGAHVRTTQRAGIRSAAGWAVAALAAGATLAGCAPEGNYPDGTVELMVPWSAGGGSDLSARLFEIGRASCREREWISVGGGS